MDTSPARDLRRNRAACAPRTPWPRPVSRTTRAVQAPCVEGAVRILLREDRTQFCGRADMDGVAVSL
eukprot:4536296-Prymnesium_polylepis.2